jgi:hypothetical protein
MPIGGLSKTLLDKGLKNNGCNISRARLLEEYTIKLYIYIKEEFFLHIYSTTSIKVRKAIKLSLHLPNNFLRKLSA